MRLLWETQLYRWLLGQERKWKEIKELCNKKTDCFPSLSFPSQSLTFKEFQALKELLQQSKGGQEAQVNQIHVPQIKIEGMVCVSPISNSIESNNSWILDFGATNHICGS